MTRKCCGCGLELQTTNPNLPGFTPKDTSKLCERCFKLKNYNQKVVTTLKYTNVDIINLINRKCDAAFFVTDFLGISKEVIDIYNEIKVKKYMVINKADYIPSSINKVKYLDYIKNTYDINDDVILISAKKNYNLNELCNKLSNYKNSFFCGFTNSGKSTIINKIASMFGKPSNILESLMPNTTLDTIKIKLDDNINIFDTPGFITTNNFDDKTYPKAYLKPITIQVKNGDCIMINSTYYIKCNISNSFTFYMSGDVPIKKIYNENVKYINNINITDNTDFLINSYGFINIKSKCNIKTNISSYEIRKSMF